MLLTQRKTWTHTKIIDNLHEIRKICVFNNVIYSFSVFHSIVLNSLCSYSLSLSLSTLMAFDFSTGRYYKTICFKTDSKLYSNEATNPVDHRTIKNTNSSVAIVGAYCIVSSMWAWPAFACINDTFINLIIISHHVGNRPTQNRYEWNSHGNFHSTILLLWSCYSTYYNFLGRSIRSCRMKRERVREREKTRHLNISRLVFIYFRLQFTRDFVCFVFNRNY